MISIVLAIGFACLDFIYLFIKLCPTKHKVVFLSRQYNKPSADYTLVKQQLLKDDPTLEIVMLCKMLEGGIVNKIKYAFHMFEQLYHIATSEVAILDGYCIVISCLHHKKNLKVIQLFHGQGAFKKFAYSVIGKEEGSSLKVAKAMHMHEGYDYVFTSAPKCAKYFAEAFNVEENKMVVAPLPKVDLLRSKQYHNQTIQKIYEAHPELKDKPIVLYAPTFRKDETLQVEKINEFIDKFNFEKYHLVFSLHPVTKAKFTDERIISDASFTSFEWSMIADKVITDFSSTVFEIAVVGKPIYFYVYDVDTYLDIRGLYISLDEFPGPKCQTADELIEALDAENYDLAAVKKFADDFVDPTIEDCCAHISNIIRNYPLNH